MSLSLTCCTVEVYRTQMGHKQINGHRFPSEITCVRFLEIHFSEKGHVRFFRMFLKLFSAIILGVRNISVRNFRTFTVTLKIKKSCRLKSM